MKSSILFILGLFLFLSIVGGLLTYGGKKSGGKVNWIMSHSIDAEIPIFGSSVAHVHLNPKIIQNMTGRSCYNLGMFGINLSQYNGVLHEFMTYTQSENIVIVGTFREFESRDKLYAASSFINYIDNKFIYESLKSIDSVQTIKASYVPFYKFILFNRDFYFSAIKSLFISSPMPFDDSNLGFMPMNDSWQPVKSSNKKGMESLIDSDVVEIFRNTITLANKKGIKVILVFPPIYIEGQEQMVNLVEIIDVFKNLAGKQNIFLDFTSSNICLEKKYFYNNLHLNSKGADAFSTEFAIKLKDVL